MFFTWCVRMSFTVVCEQRGVDRRALFVDLNGFRIAGVPRRVATQGSSASRAAVARLRSYRNRDILSRDGRLHGGLVDRRGCLSGTPFS